MYFQIFYFSLFANVFGIAFVLTHFQETLKSLVRHWYFIILTIIVFTIVIYFNTLIHPYLLADNRHYTFYIWNRIYGKYELAKYLLIPIYIFAIGCLLKSIENKSAGFRLSLIGCITVAIALQKLIEIRYFIIPFLLIRLNTGSIKTKPLIVELIFYLLVNVITFYIFFTKEIYWSNYEMVQRLIW